MDSHAMFRVVWVDANHQPMVLKLPPTAPPKANAVRKIETTARNLDGT
jgi:hypothetical protein